MSDHKNRAPQSEVRLEKKELEGIVGAVSKTYNDLKGINHIQEKNLPSRKEVYHIMDDLFEILFPGYLGHTDVTWADIDYFIGEKVNSIFQHLTEQAVRALRYQCKLTVCNPVPEDKCLIQADRAVRALLEKLPEIRDYLKDDVEAAYNGDPAATSFDEIILSYPCVEAIATHRIAHILYGYDIPLIPRMMAERAHSRTGIDINPGATIGRSFFIDHATGVVIGETTVIGRNVKIYQGVTLGALSIPRDSKGNALRDGGKRHPTIEDNVTIYSNATILGGKTVIGKNSVIGGNVWLTNSVPPNSRVTISNPDLCIKGSACDIGQ